MSSQKALEIGLTSAGLASAALAVIGIWLSSARTAKTIKRRLNGLRNISLKNRYMTHDPGAAAAEWPTIARSGTRGVAPDPNGRKSVALLRQIFRRGAAGFAPFTDRNASLFWPSESLKERQMPSDDSRYWF